MRPQVTKKTVLGFRLHLCMAVILFDPPYRNLLAPLSTTKAVAQFHFGLLSVKERWELLLNELSFIHTAPYLQNVYLTPNNSDASSLYEETIWIDASVLPNESLVNQIKALRLGDCLMDEFGLVAGKSNLAFSEFDPANTADYFTQANKIENSLRIRFPWEIMQINDSIIRSDFAIVTANRNSQPIPSMVNTIGANQIFLEEGAKLTFCTLNASTGPIYIGRKAEIMEGSCIRGPFAIGYNSVVKMNSRIYGGTSLGPYCMGGGEIKNAVMMGYSNKAHDGYLGDAVIGEWCNLGAGSSNSNLKNSAGTIKIFNMGLNDYVSVGQKCGVIMGDYSRVAINSSLNTGSMIGVSCNVFGEGLLHNTIPHFSFGVKGKQYDLNTAIKDINNWKGLKEMELSKDEINILQYIFTNNKQL